LNKFLFSALDLSQDMIHNLPMFMLGTEEDDLGLLTGSYGMSGRPIKQVPGNDCISRTIRISYDNCSFQHVTPVWGLAHVSFQPLEQRRKIDSFAKREVFTPELAVSGYISKIRFLAGDSTRSVDFYWYIFFGYSHKMILHNLQFGNSHITVHMAVISDGYKKIKKLSGSDPVIFDPGLFPGQKVISLAYL
jgi:hypothetical protein